MKNLSYSFKKAVAFTLLGFALMATGSVTVMTLITQPSAVVAQGTNDVTGQTGGSASTNRNATTVEESEYRKLKSPFAGGDGPQFSGDVSDFDLLFAEILSVAVAIGVPIVAIALVYVGFLFVSAQGNPDKIKKAKQALLWVLVGGFIIIGAEFFANTIKETVEQAQGAFITTSNLL